VLCSVVPAGVVQEVIQGVSRARARLCLGLRLLPFAVTSCVLCCAVERCAVFRCARMCSTGLIPEAFHL
jgi:hypothetical protein